MKLSDFDYNLPKELVAQKPVRPRDHSKLMVIDRQSKKIEHKHFYKIVDYLKKGDVLVLNDTKVFPARLIGRRQRSGGKVEVFLLKKSKKQKIKKTKGAEVWEVLIGNRRKRIGQIIEFGKGLKCEILRQVDESVWEARFNKSDRALEKLIDELGQVPLPPYIKKTKKQKNKKTIFKEEYQTVYAQARGSVAGPTAGFHFTKSLINKLRRKGVQFEFITLHVGYGTFEPVKTPDIKKHKMHAEFAILDSQTAKRLNQAKKEGRRVIAVGTTTVRVLEAFSRTGRPRIPPSPSLSLRVRRASNSRLPKRGMKKWIDTFIYPGYKFKFIDAMLTNFHLPRSTLLMLVSAFAKAPADRSAFAGRQFILKAYQVAVKKKYRFYSFGDGMLIW